MRVGNHIFASIIIWSCLYFNATFVVSSSGAHAQEAPPFRAWWPIVNLEVEVGGRGFYAMDPSESKDGERKQKHGVGAGVSDWLFFEFETVYKNRVGEQFQLSAYELETRIELTETKAFNEAPNPLDIGILLGIAAPNDSSDPYELESRLLLYKRSGPWRATGNIILEKEFGNSRSDRMELAYANQIRYRITPNIQPGLEMFGRLGSLGELSVGKEQHKVGPGLFGFLEVSDDVALKYELTWLWGITSPAPDHSLKWLLEFEYRY